MVLGQPQPSHQKNKNQQDTISTNKVGVKFNFFNTSNVKSLSGRTVIQAGWDKT
jgi:hypothetical protein